MSSRYSTTGLRARGSCGRPFPPRVFANYGKASSRRPPARFKHRPANGAPLRPARGSEVGPGNDFGWSPARQSMISAYDLRVADFELAHGRIPAGLSKRRPRRESGYKAARICRSPSDWNYEPYSAGPPACLRGCVDDKRIPACWSIWPRRNSGGLLNGLRFARRELREHVFVDDKTRVNDLRHAHARLNGIVRVIGNLPSRM